MVFSYSIKYLPTLLYTVWTFGKGNRLLSFGYYALNKNEGITYGSLKIARKKPSSMDRGIFLWYGNFLACFFGFFKICLFLTKTQW